VDFKRSRSRFLLRRFITCAAGSLQVVHEGFDYRYCPAGVPDFASLPAAHAEKAAAKSGCGCFLKSTAKSQGSALDPPGG
ncbi:MAG: hypothetical protein H7838_09400, partial [Magnetococcus sp. DMHC-8]